MPVKGRRAAALPCTPICRRRWSRCRQRAGTWPRLTGRSCSLSGAGAVAGHRALMVPSALYVAEDGRLFVALRAPHLHYPGCAQSLAGRGQVSGTCRSWPYTSLAMTQRYIEGDARPSASSSRCCKPVWGGDTRPYAAGEMLAHRTRQAAPLPAGTTRLAPVLPRPRFIHG